MAEETQTDAAEATGMAALGALTEDAAAPTIAEAPVAPAEPKIDNLGRSYATGRRKDAAARVWVKRGTGQMKINGRDVSEYFARPVLQMILAQPFETTERGATQPHAQVQKSKVKIEVADSCHREFGERR